MNKTLELLEKLPDRVKVGSCLLASLILGTADYITGDFSLMMFYFVPIAFASWFIGKKAGFWMSMLCSFELFIVNMLLAPKEVPFLSIRSWNALMEAGYLLLVGYLVCTVRAEMELASQRSKELEAANLELEAFNFTVAHDLRKPLAVVNSYCQAIQELYGGQFDEQGNRYLQEAYNGTLRMNRLIDALLNFSRMSYLEPRRELVDLSALAQEVAATLRLAEPRRKVDFRIADGIAANTDANLLRVVLENLLGNAWKYTGTRKEAVIEFGAMIMDGQQVYFVRDNGAGFDKANAEKLFMPFQRLPGAEECRGFGIGLATVERIVRRQGGKIWADGDPGQGAVFHFTLSCD